VQVPYVHVIFKFGLFQVDKVANVKKKWMTAEVVQKWKERKVVGILKKKKKEKKKQALKLDCALIVIVTQEVFWGVI